MIFTHGERPNYISLRVVNTDTRSFHTPLARAPHFESEDTGAVVDPEHRRQCCSRPVPAQAERCERHGRCFDFLGRLRARGTGIEIERQARIGPPTMPGTAATAR